MTGRRSLLLVLCAGALLTAAAVAASACSNDTTAPAEAPPDAAIAEASTDGGLCALTRAWVEGCRGDLNCGPSGFDTWCRQNDERVNSEAYRRAEVACLTPANCGGDAKRDCAYRHYATETPTAAQRALVDAWCATCEPGDTGCAARTTSYDATKGPKGATDIFVAAWELNDAITDEIRTKCTGPALDAGASDPDAGDAGNPCVRAFATCAAEPYLAHVPDCPP